MRISNVIFCVCAVLFISTSTHMQISKRIVIAAGTVLDGKGHVLHNTRIVVEGSRIVAIGTPLLTRSLISR